MDTETPTATVGTFARKFIELRGRDNLSEDEKAVLVGMVRGETPEELVVEATQSGTDVDGRTTFIREYVETRGGKNALTEDEKKALAGMVKKGQVASFSPQERQNSRQGS